MKVLISGYYGFGNAGDEAILYAIIEMLKMSDPNIDIMVLSDKPEHTKKNYGVKAVNRWRFFDVFKAVKESDGLLSGGGSLLQDETGLGSIPYYSGIMFLARLLRKPVVVFANGMGPIHRSYNRFIVKHILSKACFISVRDEASRSYLERIGIQRNIELVPDPVIGLRKDQPIAHTPSQTILVAVRSWPSRENYRRKIARALDRCVKEGFKVVFLPMHGKDDQLASESVKQLMIEKASIESYNLSVKNKLNVVAESHVLLGMRLHSLIFAAVHRVPFIGLSYDPKVDAFTKQCRQPLLGSVDGPWEEIELYEKIVGQAKYRESESSKLDALVSYWEDTIYSVAGSALAAMKPQPQ